MTHDVHFLPVFTAFAVNLPCPFCFSLPAAISQSSLDIMMLCSATKIALLLRNRIFSFKHRGDKGFYVLHFNNKKGKRRSEEPAEDQRCPKECKNGTVLNREILFSPQHCYCGSA